MKNCANCGSLQRSAADDGLCDVCAHQSLYAMREVVGEQQATIERLKIAEAGWTHASDLAHQEIERLQREAPTELERLARH
jgi:hypothetical protein